MATARKLAIPDVPALVPGVIAQLPTELLVAQPQARTHFDPDDLAELAADIKGRGIENPIIVRSDFVIKHGERRWRAAKLAGLATVPCLLEAPAAEEHPALERLLDQAADNDQHAPLTPMDWAHLLKRLSDEHDVPVGKLPELLERRGFKKLSRPYISNLIRLTELPAWAQELISTGGLNPSDGKYILMAKPWAPAMERLEKELRADAKRDPEYRHRNIEGLVHRAYSTTSIELSAYYGPNMPAFDWRSACKACEHRQQVSGSHYCLNAGCFKEKQEAGRARRANKEERTSERAKPKKPTGPTKVKEEADGTVRVGRLSSEKYHFLDAYNVRFMPAMSCTGCPHNRPAIQRKGDAPRAACFNIPCFNEHQRNGSRAEGVAQWLDGRVLAEVLAKVPGNYDLQFQTLAWMALHGPTQTDRERKVEDQLRSEQLKARRELKLTHPGAVIEAHGAGALKTERVVEAGLRALLADRGHFYALARHLGVQITPAIASIDDAYLFLKRKGELVELAKASGLVADAASLAKMKLDELKAFCLTPAVVQALGVPAEVRNLYETLQPILDADYVDEEGAGLDDEDDDVSEETAEEETE